MPARRQAPPKRATIAEVHTILTTKVLPELSTTKEIAIEARDLAKKAGLNGYGVDIHEFFEQRAEEASARKWLSRKLRPVARFRVIAAIVGFVASVGWAVMGVDSVLHLVTGK